MRRQSAEREREGVKKNERAKKELQIDASHGQQGSQRHGEKRKMRLKRGRRDRIKGI